MTGILKVDTIQSGGGTSGLTIDSSGRVFRSVIPSWRVKIINAQNVSQNSTHEVAVFNKTSGAKCHIQDGITLGSDGKITIPVAGLYQANAVLRLDSVSGQYIEMQICHETTGGTITELAYTISGVPGGNYENATASVTVKCEANEKLFVRLFTADNDWRIQTTSEFSGYLIG